MDIKVFIERATQPYKLGGKEYDTMHGLDQYDFDARQMDGFRFTGIDPMAEKYYSWSPYVYCKNNPMRFIDPDGKEPTISLFDSKDHPILLKAAEQFKYKRGDGKFTIFAHSSSRGIQYTDKEGKINLHVVRKKLILFYQKEVPSGKKQWKKEKKLL